MKYKVAELSGCLLDRAVAKAEGLPVHPGPGRFMVTGDLEVVWAHEFFPTTDLVQGGKIIDRERITTVAHDAGDGPEWSASVERFSTYIDEPLPMNVYRVDRAATGKTRMVAAMRAYLIGKFGDEVEL